ncbi:218_t:CDS:2 [Ambispora leptoticha]|uniref:218_t:CDS:1 n=1 Tax=Ambispora leptoticha TaxID=144679 RepID=A0A9N9AI02_9GLOM|nr:218_t:CDS:2 [Ambispora leptoticha]
MSQRRKSITREQNRAIDIDSENRNVINENNYSQVSITHIPTPGYFNDLSYIAPSAPPSPSIYNSFRHYTYTGAPHSRNSIRRTQKGKAANGSTTQINYLRDDSNASTPVKLKNELTIEKFESIEQQAQAENEASARQYLSTEPSEDDNENQEYEGVSQYDIIFDPIDQIRIKEDEMRSPLQRKLYYFFEVPSSTSARIYAFFSALCVLVTIIIICVESLPTFYENEWQYYRRIWLPVNLIVVLVFTVEYIGRFYASIDRIKFMRQIWNVFDLVTIIPFYCELLLPLTSESVIRYLRIFRLFRILKILQWARYTAGFHIIIRVFRRSLRQIALVSIWVFVIILTSSALMYYLERGTYNEKDNTWYRTDPDGVLEVSPFQSIIHSFWWSVVTITTTGYGDTVPYSAWGRVVAGVTMLCGVLVIAIPTSIIGSNFVTEWALHRRIEFQMRLRRSRERAFAKKKFQEETKRINKNLENFNNLVRARKIRKGNTIDATQMDSSSHGTEDLSEFNELTQSSFKKLINLKPLKFKKHATTDEIIQDTEEVKNNGIGSLTKKAVKKIRRTLLSGKKDNDSSSQAISQEIISSPVDVYLNENPPVQDDNVSELNLSEGEMTNIHLETSSDYEDNHQSIMTFPGTTKELKLATLAAGKVSGHPQKLVRKKMSHLTKLFEKESKNKSDLDPGDQNAMTPDLEKGLGGIRTPIATETVTPTRLSPSITPTRLSPSITPTRLSPSIVPTPTRLSPPRLTLIAQVNVDDTKNENNVEVLVESPSSEENIEKIQNDSDFVVNFENSELPPDPQSNVNNGGSTPIHALAPDEDLENTQISSGEKQVQLEI